MPNERHRAIVVLRQFLLTQTDPQRVSSVLFRNAFVETHKGVLGQIQFDGALDLFCPDAVDALINQGYTDSGRHLVSLLLDAMLDWGVGPAKAECESLQLSFDAQWPEARTALLRHVSAEARRLAELYAPLGGHAEVGAGKAGLDPLTESWNEDPAIQSLLTYYSREQNEQCERQSYENVLDAFGALQRAALLGDPGAGKSTTLCRLAVNLALAAQLDTKQPAPLLIHLNLWKGPESFCRFMARQTPCNAWAVAELAKGGSNVVLLLDGLNEIPTDGRPAKVKQIKEYLQQASSKSSRVFVSCRRDDYTGDLDLGLDSLTIQPLSPPRIRAAVRRWVQNAKGDPATANRFFWQLAGDEKLKTVLDKWKAAGVTEEEFWTASDPRDHPAAFTETSGPDDELFRRCRSPRSLLYLASNPLLLTMLWAVWNRKGQRLPDKRGQLFQVFVDILLEKEKLTPQDCVDLLTGLTRLAWGMQTDRVAAGPEKGGDFGVMTVVSLAEARKFLADASLLKYALGSTLLEGFEELRFRHQLLQEYFTARALQGKMGEMKASELWPPERWWERNGWEETVVLLAGFGGEDGLPVIAWLKDAQPEVAARCVEESGAKFADDSALRGEVYAAWMPRLLLETTPEGRAAIGSALGRMGLDDRAGVGLTAAGIPDIDWVKIPGGDFLYGEGKERRHVEGFAMSRYPVTNDQYRVFLESADGYGQDRWWEGLEGAERSPAEPRWGELNHPRVRVSWYEATVFCRWLSDKLGSRVELPTEEQWERAARGKEGRAYPWGEEYLAGRANVDETEGKVSPSYLGRTSTVGIYPGGATPEDVMDLSGNVWEWCEDQHEAGEEYRVLRGGSWDGSPQDARAGLRLHDHPDYRRLDVGFRLVCSSPIPPLHPGPLNGD